jgi:hypothetical protein
MIKGERVAHGRIDLFRTQHLHPQMHACRSWRNKYASLILRSWSKLSLSLSFPPSLASSHGRSPEDYRACHHRQPIESASHAMHDACPASLEFTSGKQTTHQDPRYNTSCTHSLHVSGKVKCALESTCPFSFHH